MTWPDVALLATTVALARSGLGVASVPASLLAGEPGGALVVRRLVRPAVERGIALIYKSERSLSPAASVMAGLLLRGC